MIFSPRIIYGTFLALNLFTTQRALSPEDGNLKGIADKVWTCKAQLLGGAKGQLWTFIQCPFLQPHSVGTGKGLITKGVFSLDESLESPKSLNSLESLE